MSSDPVQGAPQAGRTSAFFTDVTVCIGCKACEVACKEWNLLPDDGFEWAGLSYDHTRSLGASTYRQVKFVEQDRALGIQETDDDPFRWIFFSDVCKHCHEAGCLDACPTGAIFRTEFDSVYVQPDVCNGCGYCVVGCPFGVIDRRPDDGRAFKCTFCYDRQLAGAIPACAKACPTDAIQFGSLPDLRERADERLRELEERGVEGASVYDAADGDLGGIHAFFLVLDESESFGLPPDPVLPRTHLLSAWSSAALTALLALIVLALSVSVL